MDSGKNSNKWAWLPAAMPGVAKLIAERRKQLGDAHINECWKRGVVCGEPGWFYAAEGPIAVGTHWEDPEIAAFSKQRITSGQCVLVTRAVGAAQ